MLQSNLNIESSKVCKYLVYCVSKLPFRIQAKLKADAAAALAIKIAKIAYVFEENDQDLLYVEKERVHAAVPMHAHVGSASFLSPGEGTSVSNTSPTTARTSIAKPDRSSEMRKRSSLLLRSERSRSSIEVKEVVKQPSNGNFSASGLVQIQKLQHLLEHATDPALIAETEKQLFELKEDRVNMRRINYKKLL
jgi:hypothetical protein